MDETESLTETVGQLIICFCLAVAEENMRLAAGEPAQPKSIAEIASWFRWLLGLDR